MSTIDQSIAYLFSDCDQYDKMVSAKGCDTLEIYHQEKILLIQGQLTFGIHIHNSWNLSMVPLSILTISVI